MRDEISINQKTARLIHKLSEAGRAAANKCSVGITQNLLMLTKSEVIYNSRLIMGQYPINANNTDASLIPKGKAIHIQMELMSASHVKFNGVTSRLTHFSLTTYDSLAVVGIYFKLLHAYNEGSESRTKERQPSIIYHPAAYEPGGRLSRPTPQLCGTAYHSRQVAENIPAEIDPSGASGPRSRPR